MVHHADNLFVRLKVLAARLQWLTEGKRTSFDLFRAAMNDLFDDLKKDTAVLGKKRYGRTISLMQSDFSKLYEAQQEYVDISKLLWDLAYDFKDELKTIHMDEDDVLSEDDDFDNAVFTSDYDNSSNSDSNTSTTSTQNEQNEDDEDSYYTGDET